MDRQSDSDHHWFSFVHLADFRKRTFPLCTRYVILLSTLAFSLLLLLGEIFVSVTLLLYKSWVPGLFQVGLFERTTMLSPSSPSSSTNSSETDASILSPVVKDVLERVGPSAGWVVVGSTGLSLCVLIWNWVQARSIVESDSIPNAFLNSSAFRLWSIKSYSHFCLLSKIQWGRGIRQRIITAVYFGLQGFTAVIVVLPRLVLYGCVLYSTSNVPDFGLSVHGFQWLKIAEYNTLEAKLLSGTLVIMLASTLIHTLRLLKILVASLFCLCSLCYLGQMKKSMNRDLHYRISTLLQSKCHWDSRRSRSSFQNVTKGEPGGRAAPKCNDSIVPVSEKTETTSTVAVNQSRQHTAHEEFHEINLDMDDRERYRDRAPGTHQHVQSSSQYLTPTFTVIPTTEESVPMVHISSAAQTSIVVARNQSTFADQLSIQKGSLPPFTHSSMATEGSAGCRDTSGLTQTTNRLAALSFYDDLLKSINSERMMYASSFSNQESIQEHSTNQDEQSLDKQPSIGSQTPSIALCSSIPLTYSTGSEPEDRFSADQPVHPFDISSTPSQAQKTTTRRRVAEIHPLDVMTLNGGFEVRLTPLQHDIYDEKNHPSRCGSSHSQDTIENWRIQVAPSSPTMPVIDQDIERDMCATPTPLQQQGHQRNLQSTSEGQDGYSTALSAISDSASNSNSIYRHGTIPIILSAQLQDPNAHFLEDDDLYFSAADLHIPRPSYAYGQSRTQRQGSVNSSIGGYNYSTAASSPSLADSLSNPMYQQQSLALNGSFKGGSRVCPPRKGSLPSSLNSLHLDDVQLRSGLSPYCFQPTVQPQQQQQHQNSIFASHHQHQIQFPTAPSKSRTRAPSHLSNMVHGNNELSHSAQLSAHEEQQMDRENGSAHEISLQQKRRSHFRSHSHSVRSIGSQENAEELATSTAQQHWSSFRQTSEAQAGYAMMIDIPPSSKSRIDFQPSENSVVVRSGTLGRVNMSLQEALARDSQQQNLRAPECHENNTNRCRTSRGPYPGPNVPDHLFHPLDLSPLINYSRNDEMDFMDSRYQHHSMPQQTLRADMFDARLPWDDACVGLGLIMSSSQRHDQTKQLQQPTHAASEAQYYIHSSNQSNCYDPPQPIPASAQGQHTNKRSIPIPLQNGYAATHHAPNCDNDDEQHSYQRQSPQPSDFYCPPPTAGTTSIVTQESLPANVSRMTSFATTLTQHSDRMTHTSSFTDTTTTASHGASGVISSYRQDYDQPHKPYPETNCAEQHSQTQPYHPQSVPFGQPGLYRQPSQRNKKNLMLTIVPRAVF